MKPNLVAPLFCLLCAACAPNNTPPNGMQYFKNINILTLKGAEKCQNSDNYPNISIAYGNKGANIDIKYIYDKKTARTETYRKAGKYWTSVFLKDEYKHYIYIDTAQQQAIDICYAIQRNGTYLSTIAIQKNNAKNEVEERIYHINTIDKTIDKTTAPLPTAVMSNLNSFLIQAEFYNFYQYRQGKDKIFCEERPIEYNEHFKTFC